MKTSTIKLCLKHFNAVPSEPGNKSGEFCAKNGIYLEGGALWAYPFVAEFVKENFLSGKNLNRSFYSSIETLKNLSDSQRIFDQIVHYMSTYGNAFNGFVYIPNNVDSLDIPTDLKIYYVSAEKDMVGRVFQILESGIALNSSTISDMLTILKDLGHTFDNVDKIRNKEAMCMIADILRIYPKDPSEFLRYVIYKLTGSTLLIKDAKTLQEIRNVEDKKLKNAINEAFSEYNHYELAKIFNRHKKIFLALKHKVVDLTIINKISKLSKTNHEPMVQNSLNNLSTVLVKTKDLNNATPFALMRSLNYLHRKIYGDKVGYNFYKIRNGRVWVDVEGRFNNSNVHRMVNNFNKILTFMKKKYNLSGKTFFIPKNVHYAVPSSEKSFIGNLPEGSYVTGDHLAAGMYWHNDMGAYDLDLHAMAHGESVGWCSSYKGSQGSLLYSGDVTYAPEGAVEYMHAHRKLDKSYLLTVNAYSTNENFNFKVIVADCSKNKIDREYMMNPNNVIMESLIEKCDRSESVIGMFTTINDKNAFMFFNMNMRRVRVPGNGDVTHAVREKMVADLTSSVDFGNLLELLGATRAKSNDNVDFDLSMKTLNKDSFITIFGKGTS